MNEPLGPLMARILNLKSQKWMTAYFLQRFPDDVILNVSLPRRAVSQALTQSLKENDELKIMRVLMHHPLNQTQYRGVLQVLSAQTVLSYQAPPTPEDLQRALETDASRSSANLACSRAVWLGFDKLPLEKQLEVVARADTYKKFEWFNTQEALSDDVLKEATRWLSTMEQTRCLPEVCRFIGRNEKWLRKNGRSSVVKTHANHVKTRIIRERPEFTETTEGLRRRLDPRLFEGRPMRDMTVGQCKEFIYDCRNMQRITRSYGACTPGEETTVTYFMSRLGENEYSWDTFFALSESWDGTIDELVETARNLA